MGESGCGKTTVGRLVLRLLPVTAGRIVFDGRDVTDVPERQLREFRRAVQVVFQDPYSSLNPRLTVRDIVGRAAPELRRHAPGGGRAGRRAARHGRPAAELHDALPPRLQRRPAAADRDRAGARPRPAAPRVRRGRLLARRLGPGAGPEPARRPPAPARPRAPVHLAQPRGRAPRQPPRGGHVPRPAGRDRAGGGPLRPPAPSVHARAAGGGARGGSRRRAAGRPARARSRARSIRRRAAGSRHAAPGPRRAAAPPSPHSRKSSPAAGCAATSRSRSP